MSKQVPTSAGPATENPPNPVTEQMMCVYVCVWGPAIRNAPSDAAKEANGGRNQRKRESVRRRRRRRREETDEDRIFRSDLTALRSVALNRMSRDAAKQTNIDSRTHTHAHTHSPYSSDISWIRTVFSRSRSQTGISDSGDF